MVRFLKDSEIRVPRAQYVVEVLENISKSVAARSAHQVYNQETFVLPLSVVGRGSLRILLLGRAMQIIRLSLNQGVAAEESV